jgi:hypothetical protein
MSIWYDDRTAWLAMSQEERFWHRVKKDSTPDGCWIWNGGGSVQWKDAQGFLTTTTPRRVAWALTRTDAPPEGRLQAGCGNVHCVNPAHVNTRPTRARKPKGRPSGEQHWNAGLTEADVRAIRAARKENTHTVQELATLYDKSASTIWAIEHRQRWAHLD